MYDRGKIIGKNLLAAFLRLIENKIFIKIQPTGKSYDRLTIILDTQTVKKESFFLVDPPKGFHDVLSSDENREIRFEYTGTDKIEYHFTSYGWQWIDNQIWIRFPEFIERRQRRKFFRVETPPQSTLGFSFNDQPREMGLINLSLGGAYTVLLKGKSADRMLATGEKLFSVQLLIPGKDRIQTVTIQTAVIRRMVRDLTGDRYFYGIEFLEIKKKEEKRLTKIIYDCQRRFLRNR